MTYRIGMWIVIALMVAQASLYHLVISPTDEQTINRYSAALKDDMAVLDASLKLLEEMAKHIESLKGYISTNCIEAITWDNR